MRAYAATTSHALSRPGVTATAALPADWQAATATPIVAATAAPGSESVPEQKRQELQILSEAIG